jgi:nucleoid-associated protein YgaU
MGIFDSIKQAFGRGETGADDGAAPSRALREAGVDPEGLSFALDGGSLTVSGRISRESHRQKILDVLSGLPGIRSVQDDLVVERENRPAGPSGPAADHDSPRTYTVVSGDTLWKIAERVYGNGSHYAKIFEANREILEDPDRVMPGQRLVIPDP